MSPPPACLNRDDLHLGFLARAAGKGEELGGWKYSSHLRGAQGVAGFGKLEKNTGSLSTGQVQYLAIIHHNVCDDASARSDKNKAYWKRTRNQYKMPSIKNI